MFTIQLSTVDDDRSFLFCGGVSLSPEKKCRGPRSQGSSEAPGGDKNGPASKQDGLRCGLRFDMGVSLHGGTPKTPQNDHF